MQPKFTIYTAFANSNTDACKAACGFTKTAGYIYEQDAQLNPQRAFVDSGGRYYVQGRGFPTGDEVISLSGEYDVLCLNMEYYGPEWRNVPVPMRALGLTYHKTSEEAQWRLVEFISKAVAAGNVVANVVGLYGFAPYPLNSDYRNACLMNVSAYMPSLYLWQPDGEPYCPEFLKSMPPKEVIPVISDICIEGGRVNADRWTVILGKCKELGAKRAIYWRDCESATSVAEVKVASDAIRAAGVAVGVKIA